MKLIQLGAASLAVPLAETNAENSLLTSFDLYNTALKAAAHDHFSSLNTKKRRVRRNLWYTNEIPEENIRECGYNRD